MTEHDPRSFDHFATDYDFAASLERDPGFFLDHLPVRRRRALDVGCGTGILAFELARHFDSVLALDISEPMLSIAREKRSAANIEYRWADANRLALDQKFDAIVSHTTFHHLDDIPGVLAVLKDALEPGGTLVLMDNVSRWPRVPRYVFVVGAVMSFVPDLWRHGPGAARRLLRFRLSRPWLDHLTTDVLLSPDGFREFYARELPGASFTRLGVFMGLVWRAPER